MSDACYCDYERPDVYKSSTRKARTCHKCSECHGVIDTGQSYEIVFGKTDGDVWTAKTCARCIALRDWVTAHVPCFCWAHTVMLEDADETVMKYAHHVPGMRMEYGRLRVAVVRGAK